MISCCSHNLRASTFLAKVYGLLYRQDRDYFEASRELDITLVSSFGVCCERDLGRL